jgi:hypothetical protein
MKMSKLIENHEEFDKMLQDNNKILEKMANDKNYKCCRVLADEMDGCEDKYSIDVFPTVIYFENGTVTKRLDGLHGYGIDKSQFVKMADSCGTTTGKK